MKSDPPYVRMKSGMSYPIPTPVIASCMTWPTSHLTAEIATSVVAFDVVRNARSWMVRLSHPSSVLRLSLGMPGVSMRQLCWPMQKVSDTMGHLAQRHRCLRICTGISLAGHAGVERLHVYPGFIASKTWSTSPVAKVVVAVALDSPESDTDLVMSVTMVGGDLCSFNRLYSLVLCSVPSSAFGHKPGRSVGCTELITSESLQRMTGPWVHCLVVVFRSKTTLLPVGFMLLNCLVISPPSLLEKPS